MHELSSSFVLAYHGCDRPIAEDLINYKPFRPSANEYDWLGSGVYFWESNPARGLQWARFIQKYRAAKKNRIRTPYVIGAAIDLGYCLDLISSTGIEFVKDAYADFKHYVELSGREMPQNKGGSDLLMRRLDCAVINHIHAVNARDKQRPFETVRGVFLEGQPIYETSGFYEKTHIQICVRDLRNIKAVFRVPPRHLKSP